jgi:hypothetical protein
VVFYFLAIAFCRGWHYIQISPKQSPGGGVWRQKPPGDSNIIIYHEPSRCNRKGEKIMPSREEMIEYITETIQEASDLDLEQYFWLMMESDTNFDSE